MNNFIARLLDFTFKQFAQTIGEDRYSKFYSYYGHLVSEVETWANIKNNLV